MKTNYVHFTKTMALILAVEARLPDARLFMDVKATSIDVKMKTPKGDTVAVYEVIPERIDTGSSYMQQCENDIVMMWNSRQKGIGDRTQIPRTTVRLQPDMVQRRNEAIARDAIAIYGHYCAMDYNEIKGLNATKHDELVTYCTNVAMTIHRRVAEQYDVRAAR